MKSLTAKNAPFFITVGTAVIATIIICFASAYLSTRVINFCASYYFICYRAEDNAVSASSISNAVSNYGGAGYVLSFGGKYYVTIACYYNENDAETVLSSLSRRGLDCTILTVETDKYKINSFNFKASALYLGNLNTLNELSLIAYDCANGLDTAEYNQTTAKSVLDAIYDALNGLLSANADNCFTQSLNGLISVCGEVKEGFIYSKNVRKLQIAIIDAIICAELY